MTSPWLTNSSCQGVKKNKKKKNNKKNKKQKNKKKQKQKKKKKKKKKRSHAMMSRDLSRDVTCHPCAKGKFCDVKNGLHPMHRWRY